MNNSGIEQKIKECLGCEMDDLFIMLVPHDQHTAYSKGGLVARGKQIFNDVLGNVREQICPTYKQNKEQVINAVDMVALIATTLHDNNFLHGIPLYPFAAIVFKIGLEEICRSYTYNVIKK